MRHQVSLNDLFDLLEVVWVLLLLTLLPMVTTKLENRVSLRLILLVLATFVVRACLWTSGV